MQTILLSQAKSFSRHIPGIQRRRGDHWNRSGSPAREIWRSREVGYVMRNSSETGMAGWDHPRFA